MSKNTWRTWVIFALILTAALCMSKYQAAGQRGDTISAIGFETIPPNTTLLGDAILLAGEVETSGSIVSGGNIEAAGSICGAAGCLGSVVQHSKGFYISQSTYEGSAALSACVTGFHMATLWEILDVSSLRYAIEVGDAATHDDSGQGPPSGDGGWIRSGWYSNGDPQVGLANCEVWTSSLSSRWGTVVKLEENLDEPREVEWLGPWNPAVIQCNMPRRVWCVEDQ